MAIPPWTSPISSDLGSWAELSLVSTWMGESRSGIPDLTRTGCFLRPLASLRLSFHKDPGESSLVTMEVSETKIAKPPTQRLAKSRWADDFSISWKYLYSVSHGPGHVLDAGNTVMNHTGPERISLNSNWGRNTTNWNLGWNEINILDCLTASQGHPSLWLCPAGQWSCYHSYGTACLLPDKEIRAISQRLSGCLSRQDPH